MVGGAKFRIVLWAAMWAAAAQAQASPRVAVSELETANAPSTAFRLDGLRRGGKSTWLQLRPLPVFAPDARVVVVGADGVEREEPLPDLKHFIGTERGDAATRVLVSLAGDGSIRGWVMRDGQVEAFARPPGDRGGHPLRLVRVEMERGDGQGFTCDTDRLGVVSDAVHATGAGATTGGPGGRGGAFRLARVAVDTDPSYLDLFGGNTANATRYAADLLAFSSATYLAETGYGLALTYIRYWGGSAPWVQASNSCRLYEFGKYWNDNMGAVQRTNAILLSAKLPRGGIAWVGQLCRTNAFSNITGAGCPGLTGTINVVGAYAYVGGMTGTFNPAAPQVMWDSMAVAHEIGHNFNSPHTHCYINIPDNGKPPVDECYVESSNQSYTCFDGTPSLPGPQGQGTGTLMSYCHLLAGGFSNMSFTFGLNHPWGNQPGRVPARMRDYAEQRDTAVPGCFMGDGIFANGFQ